MKFDLRNGDCLDVMRSLPDASVSACVTDPPYGLSKEPDIAEVMRHWIAGDRYEHGGAGFMGKSWDSFVPGPEYWREVYRVLKPGGYLLAFAGTRTVDLMAISIRFAGFEIRDMLSWLYGSGFPKSLDVSKAIDKHGGQSVAWFGPWFRQWREERKITQKQVAALFPSRTGGLTGCVANWELGLNMPTPDQFNLIRDTFGLPFDTITAAEREIVRQQQGTRLAVAPGENNDRARISLDITAPGSDAARAWSGWGTALKPACEPIVMARKPLAGTVAANVQKHGTGAINIDATRIQYASDEDKAAAAAAAQRSSQVADRVGEWGMKQGDGSLAPFLANMDKGRWPANLLLDEAAAALLDEQSGSLTSGEPCGTKTGGQGNAFGVYAGGIPVTGYGDAGGASRFFYVAKPDRGERDLGCDGLQAATGGEATGRVDGSAGTQNPRAGAGRNGGSRNIHPTVKPIDLMRWLCRLVTPKDGVVLDPFMGSGSTGVACSREGLRFIGIEREPAYFEIAKRRLIGDAPLLNRSAVKTTEAA